MHLTSPWTSKTDIRGVHRSSCHEAEMHWPSYTFFDELGLTMCWPYVSPVEAVWNLINCPKWCHLSQPWLGLKNTSKTCTTFGKCPYWLLCNLPSSITPFSSRVFAENYNTHTHYWHKVDPRAWWSLCICATCNLSHSLSIIPSHFLLPLSTRLTFLPGTRAWNRIAPKNALEEQSKYLPQ